MKALVVALMNSKCLFILIAIMGSQVRADVAGQILQCQSLKGHLEVHRTIAPNIFQATYEVKKNKAQMAHQQF